MQPLIQTLKGSQRELETPEAQEALGSSAEGMSERLSRSIESLEMEPASREDPREMELKRAQERVAQSEAAVERAKAESARFAPQEISERPPPSGSLGPSQKSILQFEQILNFIVLYIRLNLLLIINNISSEKEKHEAILDRAKKEAAKEAAERQAAARKAAKEVEAQRRREEAAARKAAKEEEAQRRREEAAARKAAKEEEAQRRREEAAEAKAKAERDKKAVGRQAMEFDDDSDDEELQQEAAARTMQKYRRKQQERKEKAAEAERQSKFITTWKRSDSGPSTQPAAAPSAEPPE
jgi:hypothetical protein